MVISIAQNNIHTLSIIVSVRYYNGDVKGGYSSCIVLNSTGAFLTCKYLFDLIVKKRSDLINIKEYEKKKSWIKSYEKKRNKKRKLLRRLKKRYYHPEWIMNIKLKDSNLNEFIDIDSVKFDNKYNCKCCCKNLDKDCKYSKNCSLYRDILQYK
ncbi:hypothetical protein RI065_08225 [Mycoplasmatota bacterium zrk1]